MSFTVYRLTFSDPLQFYEQLGDPVTNQGGAPVPALRAALRHSVALATFDEGPETVASRKKLRRQWRSLANNTPMKLRGLFLNWTADPENSGWYLPDQGQLVDIEGAVGLATGVWKVENFVWIKGGTPRTHRRAQWIYLKPLGTGEWPRDYRRLVFSTDYSALTPLALSYFPPGSSDLLSTGAVRIALAAALPAGADTGQCVVAEGMVDGARVSFEQTLSSRNLGQVIAYDRRGEKTAPTGGPGSAWEEFYGPDYPYSWTEEGGAIDAPVLENGRCRVRYALVHSTACWVIDVWTGSVWEEQGQVNIRREGETSGIVNELVSASLVEYDDNRAVIQAVMRNNLDATSREEVFITLQRGWSGPRIEVYPVNKVSGKKADANIIYSPAATDTNDSLMHITGTSGATGLGLNFSSAAAAFAGLWKPESGSIAGENFVTMARWKGFTEALAFGVNFAVLQAELTYGINQENATGVERNCVEIYGAGRELGYCGVQLGYVAQHAQQQLEAENMTKTGFSEAADAAASNGKAATTTQTTDTNKLTQATWPNGDFATYRVFARVKTTAGEAKLYAKTGTTTGTTVGTPTTTYKWIDLGEVVAANTTLEIHAWTSSGTLSVDRIEAYLTEDRNVNNGGIFEGGRDLSRRTLYDSRAYNTLVTRSV